MGVWHLRAIVVTIVLLLAVACVGEHDDGECFFGGLSPRRGGGDPPTQFIHTHAPLHDPGNCSHLQVGADERQTCLPQASWHHTLHEEEAWEVRVWGVLQCGVGTVERVARARACVVWGNVYLAARCSPRRCEPERSLAMRAPPPSPPPPQTSRRAVLARMLTQQRPANATPPIRITPVYA